MGRQYNINTDFLKKMYPLFTGHQICTPGHFFGPVVRNFYLLHFVVSGKGIYQVGKESYEVTPGKAFLIKPGEVTLYTADQKDPWHYVWLGFESAEEYASSLPYIIDNRELAEIMNRLVREDRFAEKAHFYFCAAFFEIMDCLFKNTSPKNQSHTERAIAIIKQQYMTGITVGELAKQLGLERSYFSNLFKADTGKSPMQYLADYRMKTALSMLKQEKYSVSVIAASVGYNDLFGFSRYFKKYYGVSPLNYKKIQIPD